MHQLIQQLSDWYSSALQTGGYPLIALLMAVESSVFPLPSEVVIPPAAHLAHTGQLPLSLWGIVLAGTVGSWLGATAMYWAGRWAGRPPSIQPTAPARSSPTRPLGRVNHDQDGRSDQGV